MQPDLLSNIPCQCSKHYTGSFRVHGGGNMLLETVCKISKSDFCHQLTLQQILSAFSSQLAASTRIFNQETQFFSIKKFNF